MEGTRVDDAEAFAAFMAGPVARRSQDADAQESFEDELRALAPTGMKTEFLERFLHAVPEEKAWELGEALAETLLERDRNRDVTWPWNESRDRRTPRASLPGADLVGLCRDDDGHLLLFGEVKTSGDTDVPPGVVYGKRGLTWQLESNATRLDIQHALLRWLCVRCTTRSLRSMYKEAVTRYLRSEGKEIVIVGVLLRDTPATPEDVRSRAVHLAEVLLEPTQVEILVWYLPVPIAEWTGIAGGAS